MGVTPVVDDEGPTEVMRLSRTMSVPKNSSVDPKRRNSMTVYNRFSRANSPDPTSNWSRNNINNSNTEENFEIFPMRREPTIQFVDNPAPRRSESSDDSKFVDNSDRV